METLGWTAFWALGIALIYFQALPLPPTLTLDDHWWFLLSQRGPDAPQLGVQQFFSYGPLFPWLGFPLPGGASFHPGGFLCQVFFLATLVRAMHRLSLAFLAKARWERWIHYVFITLSIFLLNLTRHSEYFYQFWMIAQWSALCLEEESSPRRLTWLLWAAGGALLLPLKGSLGFTCAAMLALAWVAQWALKADRKNLPWPLVVYGVVFLVVFRLTAGQWNPLPYLRGILSFTAGYPESNALSPRASIAYLPGLLAAGAAFLTAWFFSTGWGWARRGPFLAVSFVWLFFAFKHGFIRADNHMLGFYQTLLPVTAFWNAASPASSVRNRGLAWACLLSVWAMLNVHLGLLGRLSVGDLVAFRAGETRWNPLTTTPLDRTRPQALPQDAVLGERYKTLVALVGEKAKGREGGKRPSLALVSNRLLLFRLFPDFSPRYLPSLLSYASSGSSWLQAKNVAFLDREDRPDYLLMEAASIDDRDPLFDLSHLLKPLLEHYRSVGFADGFVLLERIPAGGAVNPPVTLPYLRMATPSPFFRLTHFLLRAVLKPPVMLVRVTYQEGGKGPDRSRAIRVDSDDLRSGLFFCPDEYPKGFPPAPGASAPPLRVKSIDVRWTGWGAQVLARCPKPSIGLFYLDPRKQP